jgi:CMP-N-acetylneuraminic acid synthetase
MYYSDTKSHFWSSGFFPNLETSRRQDLPPVYLRDGCYYFVGIDLINQGLQVGNNPEGYIRQYPWSINLDSKADWTLAESIVDMPNWADFIRKGELN